MAIDFRAEVKESITARLARERRVREWRWAKTVMLLIAVPVGILLLAYVLARF
jgi:hypothetical protein